MTFEVLKYPYRKSINAVAIYNSDKYLSCYSTDNLYGLVLVKDQEVLAQMNLYIKADEAYNAPFSGFGGVEHALDEELLSAFIDAAISWCNENGIKKLNLKLPPPFYAQNAMLTQNTLSKQGFNVMLVEINQHINVSGSTPYLSIIRKNEKKRLRKCHEAGFEFKQMTSNQLALAYELINDNWTRKGFEVTMSYEALKKMFQVFPEKYLLFGVFHAGKLVATSVSIRVTQQVMYNFYHGDAADYRAYSPIVMLIDQVYAYCQHNQISYLDLGTSSVGGVISTSLYEFKRNCGCVATPKKIVTRTFEA